jgi:hypothetical protein
MKRYGFSDKSFIILGWYCFIGTVIHILRFLNYGIGLWPEVIS